MDSDGLHARLLRLRPRTVLNRPPLTLRGGLRASASVPVRPAALGERVQDSGCRRWDRGRQLAGHGTGHWLVARPLIDKARDERQVSRHDRHSPSPGCASCLRRPTSGGSICPSARAAPRPARTCAASARCRGAGQAADEIAARWAELGFTRLLEALYMLFDWQSECFRQNSCQRLRQRSNGTKSVFG